MAIVQCPNQHYYDDSKNSECPYCQKLNRGESSEFGEKKTVYFESTQEEALTEARLDDVDENDKTIGIFEDEETGNTFVTGWLVCMNGLMKGKDYTLHAGRNFAGRSLDMDLVLTDDGKLSEKKHFSIIYDPKTITYYFMRGNGLCYINGESVEEEYILHAGDRIKAGDTEYVFIPFCEEGRKWEESEEE